LEFDDRPGMKYWARPAEVSDPKLYKHSAFGELRWSGTFMVRMTAHQPFAHMDPIGVEDAAELDANGGFLRDNTGMLLMHILPPLDHSGPIGQTKTLLLYNPGNERAYLNVYAAGDVGADGLLIYNRNTDQRCRIVNLTAAETVDIDTHLEIDAEHGKVYTVRYGAKTLAFPYHDEGYIQLEGAHPIERDVSFSYVGNEREIRADRPFRLDHVGKYVYLHAQWVKITSVKDLYTARVDFTFSHSGVQTSSIVTMNEIVLTGAARMTLPRLEFGYVPLFS